jgi:hypothetical protein
MRYIGAAADRLNGRPLLRRFALYACTSSGRSHQSRPIFRAARRPDRIAWRTELVSIPRIAAASATVSGSLLAIDPSSIATGRYASMIHALLLRDEAACRSTRMRVL